MPSGGKDVNFWLRFLHKSMVHIFLELLPKARISLYEPYNELMSLSSWFLNLL